MPDYQLGKIYKVVCNTTGLTYYGSTCEPTLARRLVGHRSNFKLWKNDNTKQYMTSFKCLEGENYEIVLVEFFQCNNKMELHQRERDFIEKNVCVNKFVPTRTNAEYRIEKREEINEKQRANYSDNKELIGEKQKLYRIENKEKTKIYYVENKKDFCEKAKIYYIENKKEIGEKKKLYNIENRELISEKQKKKYECECGRIITKSNHLRHDLTKKHIDFINNKPVT